MQDITEKLSFLINKNKKLLQITGITLLILALFYTLALPKIINLNTHREEIFKIAKLDQRVNGKMKLGRLGLELPLTGGFVVTIDKASVFKNNGDFVVSGKDLKIKVAFIPLIFKEIVIKDFHIKDVKGNINRIGEYKLDIEEIPLPPLPDDIFFLHFKGSKANIGKYNITLKDQTFPEEKTFLLNGDSIKLYNFTENKKIKGRIQGTLNKTTPFNLFFMTTIPLENKNLFLNKLKLRGFINNLNLKTFADYTEFKKIQGNIDLQLKNKLKNKRLNFNSGLKINSPIQVPELNIKLNKGNFHINGFIHEHKLLIKELKSTINDIDLNLKGKIKHWQKPSSKLDIHLSTNMFNIKNLIKLLPLTPETKHLINKINLLKPAGKNQAKLHIKGKLNKPLIYGDLAIKDYSFTLPNNVEISDITSIFHFNGSLVSVKNWLIILPDSDLLQIQGGFNFNKLEFDHLNISSTNFKIQTIKDFLQTLIDTFDYRIPLIEKISIKGDTKFNFDLYGKIFKPFIKGKLEINASKIKLIGTSNSIQAIKGILLFKKDVIDFNNLILQMTQNTAIKISGNYDFVNEDFEKLHLYSEKINITYLQNIFATIGSTFNSAAQELNRFIITGSTKLDITLEGPFTNLLGFGSIYLNDIDILDKETSLSVDDITGEVVLNKSIYANNITAKILNNPLAISSVETLNGKGEVKVTIPDFKLNSLKKAVPKLNILKPEELELFEKLELGGSVHGYISLKTNNNQMNLSSEVNLKENSISHPFLHDTITISKGGLLLKDNIVSIKDISVFSNGTTFTLKGSAKNLEQKIPTYNINLSSSNITKELIQKIGAHSLAPAEFTNITNSITKMTGDSRLFVTANNSSFDAAVKVKDLSIYSNLLDHPLSNISGDLKLGTKEVFLNHFSLNYGTSDIKLNGGITQLTSKPIINFNLNGRLSPIDFKQFYIPEIRDNLVFSDPIILNGYAKGNFRNWDLNFTSSIPANARIEVKGLFKKPDNIAINFIIDGKGTKEYIDIDKVLFEVGESKFLAKGLLEYTTDNLLIDNMSIKVPVINLDQLNEFMDKGLFTDNLAGEISSDLNISGTALNPDIEGFISFKKVSLPMIKTKDVSFNIDLLGRDAVIRKAEMDINGIKFEASAYVNDFRKLPIQITNLQVYSPSLKLTKLLESISTKTQDVQMDTLPIEIKTGFLRIDDAIIDKLITSNLKGNLYLCSNGDFQINNLQLNTAGGETKGNLYLNFFSETLGAQIEVVGVKANAVATTLLDLPNEVFGDLNATIIFQSRGTEYEQILQSVQGKASLIISNGRFSKLGTLEHLLTATNIIGSGITGINLNNIIASVIPMHTGSFKFLTGDFSVTKGVLHTNNLTTRGKNLSLEISGDFNITTEEADLDVKGSISRTVSGLLGPLGKLNIDTLADFVPGLGFIPGVSKKRGLLDFIPGLGFIPGFGGPKSNDKMRKFAVEIKGNPYKGSSIKNFRWTN